MAVVEPYDKVSVQSPADNSFPGIRSSPHEVVVALAIACADTLRVTVPRVALNVQLPEFSTTLFTAPFAEMPEDPASHQVNWTWATIFPLSGLVLFTTLEESRATPSPGSLASVALPELPLPCELRPEAAVDSAEAVPVPLPLESDEVPPPVVESLALLLVLVELASLLAREDTQEASAHQISPIMLITAMTAVTPITHILCLLFTTPD